MIRKEEKISIIVPVYNVSNYIRRCIFSIINQTYHNIEIIIVDDGSTDKSSDICDEFINIDNRVKVFHKENGGLSDARNYGMKYATGDLIGFVDSDDYIEPDMYDCLIQCIDKDVSIACCGVIDEWEYTFDRYYANNKPKYEKFTRDEAILNFLKIGSIGQPVWNKLFRREIIGNDSFEVGKTSEDIPFVYNCLKKSKSIIFNGKSSYHYCHRFGSITNSSFSLSRLDNHEFVKNIYSDVKSIFPMYEKEGHKFYVSNLIYWAYIMYRLNVSDQYKEQFEGFLEEINSEKEFIELSDIDSFYKDRYYELISFCNKDNKYKNYLFSARNNLAKMQEFYELLCQWIKRKQTEDDILKQLKDKNIKHVAVYGIKELGQLIIEELLNENFQVDYVIDKSFGNINIPFKKYNPDENLPKVDAIIVTAIHYYPEIKNFLENKIDTQIYSLNDLVFG